MTSVNLLPRRYNLERLLQRRRRFWLLTGSVVALALLAGVGRLVMLDHLRGQAAEQLRALQTEHERVTAELAQARHMQAASVAQARLMLGLRPRHTTAEHFARLVHSAPPGVSFDSLICAAQPDAADTQAREYTLRLRGSAGDYVEIDRLLTALEQLPQWAPPRLVHVKQAHTSDTPVLVFEIAGGQTPSGGRR